MRLLFFACCSNVSLLLRRTSFIEGPLLPQGELHLLPALPEEGGVDELQLLLRLLLLSSSKLLLLLLLLKASHLMSYFANCKALKSFVALPREYFLPQKTRIVVE
jgi:hypothetical protein